MRTTKQKNRWIGLIFALLLTVSAAGCTFLPPDEVGEETHMPPGEETDAETEHVGETEGVSDDMDDPAYRPIPPIALTKAEGLPSFEDLARFQASPVGGNPTIFFFGDDLTFYIRRYLSADLDAEYYTGTLTLPEGFSGGSVVRATAGAGSGEAFVLVEAIRNGEKAYLDYFFNYTNESFLPQGAFLLDDGEVDAVRRAMNNTPIRCSIYLCDDVYRTADTPTYGEALVYVPIAMTDYVVKDCKILFCYDGCDPTDVLSRAFWGYAPAWRISRYEELTWDKHEWRYNARRYINEVPAEIQAQMREQGAPNSVIYPRDYLYLVTLDEFHYAYIHIVPKGEPKEKLPFESKVVNDIMKYLKVELSLEEFPAETVFKIHSYRISIERTISVTLPRQWYYSHSGSSVRFDERDRLDVVEMSSIKRVAVWKTDLDFEQMKAELVRSSSYEYIFDSSVTGTTAQGYQYEMGHATADGTHGYIFLVATDRDFYRLEVWSWDGYDDDSFFEKIAMPVVNSFSVECHEPVTITDIADWENLCWREERDHKGEAYWLVYNLVSGESEIPEFNGLGIEDYSITLLEDGAVSTLRFTFTVTGNSLPETLPPGTYTKILHTTVRLFLYDNEKPEENSEYAEANNIRYGLDQFGHIPAAQAVHTYLNIELTWEIPSFGQWTDEVFDLPYDYICDFYGDENMRLPFDEVQHLMLEKFGVTVERPTERPYYLSYCKYDPETDTVAFADTRGRTPHHRIIGVSEEDGVTYVTVQLYADRLYLIPAYKVVYAIGEGEVFLGCEVIERGNYEPYSM